MLRKKHYCGAKQRHCYISGSVSASLFQLKQLRVTFDSRTRLKPRLWNWGWCLFHSYWTPEGTIAQKSHIFCHRSCQLRDFFSRLNDFSDPPSDFFPKNRLATNLATSWTNFSESLRSFVLLQQRKIRTHAPLSLHLLCSVSVWEELPIQLKQILCYYIILCFSNCTCKYSRIHSTVIVFALSYLVCIIWFHQTTAQ